MQREWQQISANGSFHQDKENDNDRADNQIKKALEYKNSMEPIEFLVI